jgi:hypothetical protein
MILLLTGCFLFSSDEEKELEKNISTRKRGEEIAKEYAERTEETPKDTATKQAANPEDCSTEDGIDAPLVDDCVTGELACGDVITGHTTGGSDIWDNDFYLGKYCTPMPRGYGGGERVYRFIAPADSIVDITLESPCADLDLFSVQWSGNTCPTAAHNTGSCDSDVTAGGGSIELYQDRTPRTYLVGVDGKKGAEAPFTLSVTCHERE